MFKKLPTLPTLKSLPQAIGLPFLSTQEDAQLKFKSAEGGVKRLYSDQVIPLTDFGYWSQYYTVFNSAADVSSLISVQDVRQALQSQPTNLFHLILTLSHHLFTLLPSPLFPTSASSASQQNTTQEALNCLRVLGRVIVVIYENDAERREMGLSEESFAKKYLWSPGGSEVDHVPDDGVLASQASANVGARNEGGVSGDGEGGHEATQFEIGSDDEEEEDLKDDDAHGHIEQQDEDEDEDEIDAGVRAFKATIGNLPSTYPAQPTGGLSKREEASDDPLSRPGAPVGEQHSIDDDQGPPSGPCLVDRLFSCTIDLLFCAGFTVPDSVRGTDKLGEKINYVIWEKGVGSTVSVGSSGDLDRNKTEVLRFLIILLSTTIYTPPHSLFVTPNLPLQHLTHSLERRLVLSLLCSLLNTSLTIDKGSKGLSGMTGQLPYNHLISKSAEERRTLVRGCLMTLLVALDYKAPGEADVGIASGGMMGEAKEENAFRYFISKLHRKEDFAFVLGGITSILEEHMAVQNGYLPGSKRSVPYIMETFMLLWRIVDLNKRFRTYLFESGKAPDIIAYILVICLEHKDDPAHHGLLRLLSYLLQTLSADQAFANALNQSLRLTVPAKWAVTGSLADFMIVSVYSIATTPGLNPLFPALTISIANAAPYLQNVGVQASTRLLQLFKAFSAPNFLLADEGHPRLVYYLLETFNSVLYHQLNDNPNLVYAILRSHQDFQSLATFTLISGLREIKRRKAVRAAAIEGAKKEDVRSGIKRTDSELEMLAEKAALLGRTEDEDEEDLRQTPMTEESNPIITTATPGDMRSDPLAEAARVPTFESPNPTPPAALPKSEKARGKMRATSISSVVTAQVGDDGSTDEEIMKLAEGGVGPNGYVPTQEWVSSWQKGLPLDPVLVAISELLPKIQDSQSRTAGSPSSKVLNLLKEVSLGEVLPPSPPIVPRRFQWSAASAVWLTSLLWGDIYVAGLTSIGIWRDTTVKLFGVVQAPVKGRGAQVGRVLKRWGVV